LKIVRLSKLESRLSKNATAQQVPSHHNPAMPILLFSVVENAQEPTKFTFDEFGCAFN